MIEVVLRKQPDGSHKYVEGYFLTLDQLVKLACDFRVDSYDGFVSNNEAYIEYWIKNNIKD